MLSQARAQMPSLAAIQESCGALLRQSDVLQQQNQSRGPVDRDLICQMALIILVVPNARNKHMDALGVRRLQTSKKRDTNGSMAALCAKSHKRRPDSVNCQRFMVSQIVSSVLI